MKKTICLLAATMLFFGCNDDKKEPEFTILKGTINNMTTDSISVSRGEFVEKIALNKDGSFSDTLDLPIAGYYTLRVDREITRMYLVPETRVSISLNTKQFDESIRYTGDNSAENNYLVKKFLLSEKIDISPKEIMQNEIGLDSLAMIVDKNEQKYLDLLHTNKLDSSFVAMEEKAIHYKKALALERQAFIYQRMGKDSLTKGFVGPEINLDNAEDFENFDAYQQLVMIDFSKATSVQTDTSASYSDKAFAYLDRLESENIKTTGLQRISYRIRPGNEDNKEIYDNIMQRSSDTKFKEELTVRFKKIQQLKKGNPSPTFTYENYKGGETSLGDLRGKHVYIDVWATWCGPCLAQIPALQKIEKNYHGKNIHFVSISIDTENAYEKWKKMVTEKELGGIQLIADNAWDSEFVQNYAINGIPRFILVDPQGNIVSANAPRPSDPELINLFEEVGI
ncbi:MAG TPA: TlpA disulfide reductase family protein [Flavobacteriaceae bacterium]|nr:TlpA disulfide reductase family protein [Flavobacteriaceae bacterium]